MTLSDGPKSNFYFEILNKSVMINLLLKQTSC